MMNKLHICILVILGVFCCISSFTVVPNRLNFGVYHGSSKIGTLTTTQLVEDKRITYSLYSSVTIDLVMDFNIVERITDVFEAGQLKNSIHTRHINNVQKVKNTAIRHANGYTLTKDGKREKDIREWIAATVTSLYYSEPINQTQIYSQNYLKLLKLKKVKTHTYEMKLPDGKATTFEYKDGKLYAVMSNTTWGNIRFVREN